MAAAAAAALFAKKMVEESGTQVGKGLSSAVGRLVTWLRHRGSKDAEIGAAMTMVHADPTDQARVELLARVLADRVTSEPGIAQELLELVDQTRQAGDVVTVGGAHIHGDVTGGTVTQIGRDQYQLRDEP